jgi:DNA-binding transcriptional MerR regulator
MLVMTDYLTIGQMARLSGLTSKALRHYDSLGVLRPVEVDEHTGYRRYDPGQVERARQIRVLRELKVPLDDIAAILDDPESEAAFVRLAAHRRRVGARLTELQTAFYFLGKLIEGKDINIVMPARPPTVALEPEIQKKLGVELFNYVWTLLEKDDRTERENDRMVDAAHASRFFWEEVGESVNHVRGEWQISRAYATIGRREPALYHGHRCLELCEEHGIGDFDLAYAYEALARAYGVAGETETASHYAKRAYEAAEQVADEEDRELVLSDLKTLPG